MKPQLVKKPPEAPTETAARTPARDATVDEYGPLALEVATLSIRLRILTAEGGNYARLKDEIREWFAGKSPEAKFIYESDKYLVEIGARENEAQPDKQKLYKVLGATSFISIAGVSQKDVKEELTARGKPGLLGSFFTWKRSGKRNVGALPKAAREAA